MEYFMHAYLRRSEPGLLQSTIRREEMTKSQHRLMDVSSRIACMLAGLTLPVAMASSALATPIMDPELASFAVLAGSTTTNVPTSTIVGNVGVWSSGGANAITGFISSPGVAVSDPQVTGGTVQAGTANAALAQGQLTTASNLLGSMGPGTLLSSDLAGLTLSPGIYTVPAGTTNLSGTLTLDGQGNANAAWVFLMPSTLITSPNSVVTTTNTGSGAGLFWDVGSSATIDVNSMFLGNIFALDSITFNTGATDFCGRALAQTAAVTLDQNSLFNGDCMGSLAGSAGLSGGLDVSFLPDGSPQVSVLPPEAVNNVSEPSTFSILGFGLLILLWGFAKKGKRVDDVVGPC
jgi:hypothetical protein